MVNIMTKLEALEVLDIVDSDIEHDTYGLSWNELVESALKYIRERNSWRR